MRFDRMNVLLECSRFVNCFDPELQIADGCLNGKSNLREATS